MTLVPADVAWEDVLGLLHLLLGQAEVVHPLRLGDARQPLPAVRRHELRDDRSGEADGHRGDVGDEWPVGRIRDVAEVQDGAPAPSATRSPRPSPRGTSAPATTGSQGVPVLCERLRGCPAPSGGCWSATTDSSEGRGRTWKTVDASSDVAGRLQLVRLIESGCSFQSAAADESSVSVATAHRWWRRWVAGVGGRAGLAGVFAGAAAGSAVVSVGAERGG